MANREHVGGLTLSSLGLRLGLTLAQVFAIGRHAFKVPNGSILLQDAAGTNENLPVSSTRLPTLPQARFPRAIDRLRPVSHLRLGEDIGDIVHYRPGVERQLLCVQKIPRCLHPQSRGIVPLPYSSNPRFFTCLALPCIMLLCILG